MQLEELLTKFESVNGRVVIYNMNGVGGAFDLFDGNVSDVDDEIYVELYEVRSFNFSDGRLVVYVREIPWMFCSYWDDDEDEYEVCVTSHVICKASSERDVIEEAELMLGLGHVDSREYKVKKNGWE